MALSEQKPARLTPREKAQKTPTSAKLAIAAHCYHGCHGEEEPNSHKTKLAIKQCPETTCLLWPHRGWQAITGGTVGPR